MFVALELFNHGGIYILTFTPLLVVTFNGSIAPLYDIMLVHREGTRIRLHLYGPSATTADVVVAGGRGSLATPEGDVDDTVEGPAPAYLLLVTGREDLVEDVGGICAMGEAATALFDHYRFF